MEVVYSTTAISSGDGRNGFVSLADGTKTIKLASPPEMGGSGDGMNPEQLFAMGYSACFHSVLKFLARSKNLSSADSAVIATVRLEKPEGGGGFRLGVTMEVELPELDKAQAADLIEEAHRMCPYSQATRGDADVEVRVA
jgi:Ohr subfamily peroxiredoxin